MGPPEQHSRLCLPPHKRSYIFLGCLFLVFMQAGILARKPSHDTSARSSAPLIPLLHSTSSLTVHPITTLMQDAETSYRKKLGRQSQSLRAAVKEYQQRYKRPPPKGFDAWWEFAVDNGVRMVDEFDSIAEDLAPFWQLSGAEFKRRSFQVGSLPFMEIVRVSGGNTSIFSVTNGYLEEGTSPRAKGFERMIQKFAHKLPDIYFPINTRSEGRVLVPWESREFANGTVRDSSGGPETMFEEPFVADWQGQGSVWDAWRRTCSPVSASRRLFSSLRTPSSSEIKRYLPGAQSTTENTIQPGSDFTFARDTSANLNFCDKPHAHQMQGHFFSDWRTIPVLYPVLSPAKAPGFSDIRIPSHYYYGNTPRYTYGWDAVNLESREVDAAEQPWEEKEDKIFWRGASTGGGNHPSGYSHHYHRHRFLRQASDSSANNRTLTFADPDSPYKQYTSAQIPISLLNSELVDAAFVASVDGDTYYDGPEGLRRDHRYGDAATLGQHWGYKYLADLDGMGYSGHFMAFLASDSAVLKSTVYKEFYSDWIQPWLHFIPLSSSYRELYNIHAYFSGPSAAILQAANISETQDRQAFREGDNQLRRIARAGKNWKKTMGRKVDMEAYLYRLCLEYARLSADDRDTMSYSL